MKRRPTPNPSRRIRSISPRRIGKQNQSFLDWGSAPDPGIFKGIALAFDDTTKQQCPDPYDRTGASTERRRRAIDLTIPRRVASPQSPTPFRQTNDTMPSSIEEGKTYRNENPGMLGRRRAQALTRWGSVIVTDGEK